MRRHLKSRHGGKTPETLTLQDTQASASGARSKRRAYSPDDPEDMSGSDGERGHSHSHSHRTVSSSRAPSAAPPQYYTGNHAPPPPGPPPPQQNNNNLSPAILYQAAMSYEIRHALSPRPSTSSAPSPTMSNAHPQSSRRDQYPAQPMPSGYQQFPPDDYYGSGPPQQSAYPGPPAPSGNPYGQPPQQTSSYSYTSTTTTTYTSPRSPGHYAVSPGAQGSRSPYRQEQPPSGLAALAMHAAQIRPLSPLPKHQKTKSELESALGPPYAR